MFTFKTNRITGLGRVGYSGNIDIKIKRQIVGTIDGPTWRTKDSLWTVRIRIVDPNDPAGWKWVALKKRHESADAAKAWLLEKHDAIVNAYALATG
jgi:hypothetical protein